MRRGLVVAWVAALAGCAPASPSPAPSATLTPYVLVTATPDPTPVPTATPAPVIAQFAFSSFSVMLDDKAARVAPQAYRSLEGDTLYINLGVGNSGVLPEGDLIIKFVLDGRGRSPVEPDFKVADLNGSFSVLEGNGTASPRVFGPLDKSELRRYVLKDGKVSVAFKGKISPFLGGVTRPFELIVTDLPMR